MAASEPLLVHRQGHIMVITINRPEARNAINLAVYEGVGAALEDAEHDREVRVVIITGTGVDAFSAGADLKAFARGEKLEPDDPVRRAWGFAGIANHPISKPIIAAVNGAALGGGAEIVLACDLVIMAEHAVIGLPEVKRGLYPSGGGAFRIAQQIPPKLAMELLLTGDSLTAGRALGYGLVNAVVPVEQVFAEALALAERIVVNAPLSVQACKRTMVGMTNGRITRDEADWQRGEEECERIRYSNDALEGARAFVEKRMPRWTGQ